MDLSVGRVVFPAMEGSDRGFSAADEGLLEMGTGDCYVLAGPLT